MRRFVNASQAAQQHGQARGTRTGPRRAYARFILLGLLLGLLPPTAAYSQQLIAVPSEKLLFPVAGGTGSESVEGTVRGYGRYAWAWRFAAVDGARLAADADGYFYDPSAPGGRAIAPTGEQLARHAHPTPLGSGRSVLPAGLEADADALVGQAVEGEWRYSLPAGRKLVADTLQADARGHVYFHDDGGTFHGVDARGRAALQLAIAESGAELRCVVNLAGDVGCSHPAVGLFGLNTPTDGPRVVVDGIERFPASRPFVEGGTTYLPFRYLGEAMRAAVQWDAHTGEVLVASGHRTVRFSPHSAQAYIDERQVPMEPAAIVRENVVYVPIRFVAEALGAKVVWEGKTRVVQIVTRTE